MKMKNHFYLSLTLALLSTQAFAQMTDPDSCDPETQDCSQPGTIKEPNKTIYPYKPITTDHLQTRLRNLYEGENYISNIYEMEKRGLNRANTKVQPWGGSYWPLYQGMVGNTYQDKDYNTFIFSIVRNLDWKKNVRDYKKRALEVHPKIYDLSEDELATLAPSEKYDILLGDTSFDLTNRVWAYAEKWGNEKKWGFLSAINLPNDYRISNANKLMALWEGICHGWAVAAGHSERPEKTVTVTLPNGRKMPFYPNDIKALISLMWANSTIQSNVIFEGNRCNKKNPDKDKFGRYIDVEKDRDDSELLPRCADVHPGIFHVSMVNILGAEGRSFVVDKSAEAAVANQPVSGYELFYFNPRTGKEGPLSETVISREAYGKKDPFKESRNPESTHIVGVEVKLKYVDWEFPEKKETNTAADDRIKAMGFTYDLELNAEGKVVGGQWRVGRKGRQGIFDTKTHQPDFFWVVPRDWKEYFRPVTTLPKWDFSQSTLPPGEFAPAARAAHSFIYEESKRFFIESPKCPVFPINGGAPIKVDCEFRYPRPQPLINVVETLLQESRK
jgi:Transglutaminase elicitor